MAWTLEKHGDIDEQRFGHYLESTFPLYETFWATFIVPLSKRPLDIGLRPGVDRSLRRMAEAHYSIFHHLTTAHRLLGLAEDADEVALFFDATLFHASAATEMAEDFLFIWIQIDNLLANKPSAGADSLTAGEIQDKVQNFINDRYPRALKQYKERGRPIAIPLHSENDAIYPWLKELGEEALNAYGSFQTISSRVRHYRNTVAHNPILGKRIVSGRLVVPREDKLNEYDEWRKVFQSAPPDDFVEATELVSTFLLQIEEAINRLWRHMIPYCERLTVT